MDIFEGVAYLPLVLAAVVWGIERYGHRRHMAWSFELGIPFGGKSELLGAAMPTPVPDHWVASFNVEAISGPRLTFTPETDDNETATCFGVLTLTPRGSQTEANYVRRASFGPLALAAAAAATMRLHGMGLDAALVVGALFGAFWLFSVWRHKRRLDETYEVLTASLLRSAIEQPRVSPQRQPAVSASAD